MARRCAERREDGTMNLSAPFVLYVAAAYGISLLGLAMLTALVLVAWRKAKRR